MFSAQDWIRIRLELRGAQAYIARMREAARSTLALSAAEDRAAAAAARMNRAQYLHNQLLFTGRRLMFYGTLGFLALGASVAKLGFSYESTLQQARVALLPVLGTTGALNKQMNKLFSLAALSPFQFQDIVTGFTTFYKAAKLSGIGVQETTDTLRNITDALSAVPGKATAANLNRVTTAFQHMLNLGRPTGRLMQQLASLGIPIEAVLKKQLHLSDIQLRNIARSGITTRQVLDAFNKFISTTKGYHGQAFLTQTQTLTGAFSSFKDFLSQAAGGGEGGLFRSLTKSLAGVDQQIGNITKTGKAATLNDIATALDKQFSPRLHIIINLFIVFQYALKTTIGLIGALLKAIQLLLAPLGFLASLFGANKVAAKLLGIYLGILAAEFLVTRGAMLLFAAASLLTTRMIAGTLSVIRILIGTEGLLALRMALARLAIQLGITAGALETFALWCLITKDEIMAGGVITALKMFGAWLWRLVPAFGAATVAAIEFAIAAWPLTLIVLAVTALTVGLVILYYKWKPFRELVQSTVHWFRENWWWAKYFMAVFGGLGVVIASLVTMRDLLKDIYNIISHPLSSHGWLSFLHKGFLNSPVGWLTHIGPLKKLDPFRKGNPLGRQHGGYASGWTMVGERGPEMLRLPQGSRVFNQTQLASGFAGGGTLVIKVVPQSIFLDGKKIGEAISQVVTSKEARG